MVVDRAPSPSPELRPRELGDGSAPEGLTILVPTYNEADNIAELMSRINATVVNDERLHGMPVEVLCVDDSTDHTPDVIAEVARDSAVPLRCLHRVTRTNGLGGAVIAGARLARYDRCVVMDADLQHPPELLSTLVGRASRGDVDLVIASRYAGGGSAGGLATALRRRVSTTSTRLVKALFPHRLRGCTDPLTGYFLFDRRVIALDSLRPKGFKILLEMLVRQPLTFAEVPFTFGVRHAGSSKGSVRQGVHFVAQLISLRRTTPRRPQG